MDDVLLLQLHNGSREAFTRIYNYYQPRVLRYITPFTSTDNVPAEEIIQEVFIRLWMRRRDLLHVKALEPYLKKMARNHLLNIVKARRIKERHESLAVEGRKEWVDETENNYRFKEYYQLTREALELLPERRRYLFQLSTVEGYSLDEIADMTKLSKAVVKKQLTLTHQFLRKHLQERGGFPLQAGVVLLCSLLMDLK
jgi:RNA polymerase sigma-70 factor (ECF subfamily)